MTFRPTTLPTFAKEPEYRAVDLKKAKKDISGFAAAQILKCKYAGIQRPKGKDPWTAEKLLLVSTWGASGTLDLTPNIVNYRYVMTVEDCKVFEPGTVKYYVCLLQGNEDMRRRLGDTPIACQHLANGKCYDTIEEALKEYDTDA